MSTRVSRSFLGPRIQQGFTLIELLVVMSVMALLIGLLQPALARARGAARVTRCIGNLSNIGIGLEAYSSEWGGVIGNGTVAETVFANGGLQSGTRPAYESSSLRLFGWPPELGSGTMRYGILNRYWFCATAKYIAGQETAKAVYDDVFFCPDDRFYPARAKELRDQYANKIHRISYLMSDAAFWDPMMFTPRRLGEILSQDQHYNNGDGCGFRGPSSQSTPGRRYMNKEEVKYPTQKVYVWEVNAFHEQPTHGYNERDLQATVLFFDGSAGKRTASTAENLTPRLYVPLHNRMGWTDVQLQPDDPLQFYYGATLHGIRGRDFID